MSGRLCILVVTSLLAQESGQKEVLRSTLANVVAQISQSEDPELVTLRLRYRARILNTSKRSVLLPMESESSSSVLWEVRTPDRTWKELYSSGLPVYTLEHRFSECQAVSPGQTKDISFSNDQIHLFKSQVTNLGAAVTLRLTILLTCRSGNRSNVRPFEEISNTIARTDPFFVRLQSAP